MKKNFILAAILSTIVLVANAATPVQQRRSPGTSSADALIPSTSSANSARTRSIATTSSASSAPTTSARAAVRTTSARSATPSTGSVVSARAGITQKVVNSGTAIAAATANTVVDPVCQQRFFGCMDSFCMLENDNGGRCQCSNQKANLDTVLAKIESLDAQSYKLATEGVEKVELGSKADYVFQAASDVEKQANSDQTTTRRKANQLDLSMWNNTDVDETGDIFADNNNTDPYNIADKKGDTLYSAVSNICISQITGCEKDIRMLQTMYQTNIQSDCRSYENELKKRQTASAQKLAAAQKAVRDAALESFQNANKYDIGQCTLEFKKCMQTTAGCKDDFTGCVGIAAAQNAKNRVGQSSSVQMVDIKGINTKISIAASTMDALLSKRPMCDSVTNSCIAVVQKDKDAVWKTFLSDIAPSMKTAELLAEDSLRTSCISNISACFQKACKDTMDPNDPDGSYDMCLSRPETMRSLCRVSIDPCEAAMPDTTINSEGKSENVLWGFVKARLASIRVDACTTEVKDCLQSTDRCGKDYTQCIGLDRDAIRAMCPQDKLVGCQENGVFSWDKVDNIINGIYLGIDNNAITQCQKFATDKMNEICGDTASCAAFDSDEAIGTDSLYSYKNNNGDYVIDGLMSFGNVKLSTISDPNTKVNNYSLDVSAYQKEAEAANTGGTNETLGRIIGSLNAVQNKINAQIALLKSDTQIKWCIEGRDMTQIRGTREGASAMTAPRVPHLLDSYITTIFNAGIDKATKNYNKKFNAFIASANEGRSDESNAALCAAMATNSKEPRCAEYSAKRKNIFTNETEPVCVKYEVGPMSVFSDKSTVGIGGAYSTTYTIPGAKLSDLAKVTSNGRAEFIQTDGSGNMIASIGVVANYSADSNTCNVTTTTTGCKSLEAVITTNTSTTCKSGGFTFLGGNGCKGGGGILNIGGGKKTTVTTQEYHGAICTDMMEPTTTENSIEM